MWGPGKLAEGLIVINLDERPDRWQSFADEVAPQLQPLRPTRLSAVKGTALPGFGQPPYFRGRKRDRTWAGRAGCALSHRSAVLLAAAAGWERVLILEDDVQLEPGFPLLASKVADALDGLDWDLCYLGFTDPIGPFQKRVEIDDEHALYEIYGCNTNHAYLIHKRAYSRLLELLPSPENIWPWLTRYRAIDRWYSRTLSRTMVVLALSPSALNQKESLSDITGRTHEERHVNAVPGASRNRFTYRLFRLFRRVLFAASETYDVLRGMVKRARGF